MNIFVFGSTGMLGNYVKKYFEPNYNVYCIDRSSYDIAKENDVTNAFFSQMLSDEFRFSDNNVVINCAGVIKPRVDFAGVKGCLKINSLFPHDLADFCDKPKFKMIHVTTDCVFSGKKGKYIETDPHDVTDVYGRTKSLGEPENCTVVRCSIIGEEVGNNRSLLEWVRSNKGGEINGFWDQHWNGVTCLQLTKIFEQIIVDESYWKGVRHVFSDRVSKYDLLCLINEIYDLDIKVNSKSSEFCDRTLSTIYPERDGFDIPSIANQIEEMRSFNG